MSEDISSPSTEPRITPVLPETATPEQIKHMETVEPALVRLNFVRTMLQNEPLYSVWGPLGSHLLRNSTLPFRDREILITRTAWLNASQYIFSQHVRVSKSAGLTDEEIERLKVGSLALGWSDFDRALLEAVEQLRSQSMISDTTWATLESKYDVNQFIELIVVIGQYNTNSWLTNALRVQLDEWVAPQSVSR